MRALPLPPVALGIVLFCAYGCRDLLDAWIDSPFDGLGWIALSVWGLPLIVLRQEEVGGGREGGSASPVLLGGGLGMGLIGALGSLNVLQHAGLALSLAGLLPWRWGHMLWLAAAASWMPVCGWALGRHCAVEVVPLVRMGVAAAGVLWVGFRFR
ncbi:MAG: hypothetical protein A3F84_05595 [Candidatus Handelsmanbacteria bacterium RIFCSPLOWO2_12_FULL_64_10]|uniref:Uncharacterized protein n=1 Tax=Handelsmanbacteria sp. (strain RIFCSPLOWO2_12_FULL_64_10) TaxID=1817868 RepID=A0A1F6C651_HANXR|nr:MAG: hypothetical protein A3F84_05595 [Candidatus Handelsmanbacteria bacterium RIFCSPLOWO2_12_FULL_64_10]